MKLAKLRIAVNQYRPIFKGISMVGRNFGKWTVLHEVEFDKPGKHYVCQCECKAVHIIPGTTLRANRTSQCNACKLKQLFDPNKMIGQKFGKWEIVKYVGIRRKLQHFECKCECGTVNIHCAADLRSNKSKQCTICHNRENARALITHDKSHSSTYKIFTAMHQRCKNPKSSAWQYYGARGIKVCDRWKTFENFYEDMGERPQGNRMSLDRIDNNGDYCKDNCRWITHKENCNNRGVYPKNRKSRKK
jgi:hypothetical protein